MMDCFKILEDMRKCGMNNLEVAKSMGISTGTMQYWKTGGQPSLNNGLRLLMLYCDVVKPKERILATSVCYKLQITRCESINSAS